MARIWLTRLAAIVLVLGSLPPVVAQEATPEATSLPLTQTFSSAGGTVTFNYPAGWMVQDFPPLTGAFLVTVVFSNQIAPPAQSNLFPAGATAVEVLVGPTSFFAPDLEPSTDITPVMVLQGLEVRGFEQNNRAFGPMTELTIGGHPAAEAVLSDTGHDDLFVMIDLDNGTYALLFVILTPGELAQWEPTVLAIGGSIVYSGDGEPSPEVTSAPIPLVGAFVPSQTYTNDAGTVTFNYPSQWVSQDVPGAETAIFSVLLSTNQAYLADVSSYLSGSSELPTGDVLMVVGAGSINNFSLEMPVTADIRPAQLLRALVKRRTPADVTYGPISSFTINNHPAAQMIASERTIQGLILLFGLGDGVFAVVGVIAAPGELDQWQPTALAIAESIVYAPSGLTPEPDSTPAA